MVKQQESLSHLKDLKIKFSNSQNRNLLKGLDTVYDEWHNFCVKHDPAIMDDYIQNMTSILDELDKENTIDEFTIKEYKQCARDMKDKFKESKYTTAKMNEYKAAQEKFFKAEKGLVEAMKNYESWRQNSLIKCLINFMLNNIEYHGQAVSRISKVMKGFIESEEEVQTKMCMTNRFLKLKPPMEN